jgi:3'-5' exoribonuclease
MIPGQEADFFALLTTKEELTTREGKPYWKVGFRDAGREVSFPVWDNSPWAEDCRQRWSPGAFYKIRASLKETNYGPQLEIRKIREVVAADAADGFDPMMCLPHSRFAPQEMFDELLGLARQQIADEPLRKLVEAILLGNQPQLLRLPAARRNHHAYVAGWLEHTLSVTRSCVYLAAKYADYYPDLQPPLDKGLVVAGGILHDIGKLREICQEPTGSTYTPSGELVGHILLGRDIVREAAAGATPPVDPGLLLRLEHVILSHQRLPEWGSPKPPMTPEALLVHYADDLDAKYHIVYSIYKSDPHPGPMTSDKNLLRQKFYRGEG